jgi:S1-C subfamily serine protease
MKSKVPLATSNRSISRGVFVCIMAAFELLISSNTTNAQRRTTGTGKKPSALNAEEIARKLLPSVVLIVCEDGRGNTSIGSGFFVATGRPQQFMIVTAYHVIRGMVRGTW